MTEARRAPGRIEHKKMNHFRHAETPEAVGLGFRPNSGPDCKPLILVVDDEEFLRSLTRRLLEAEGYRILEAADCDSARTLWQKHKGDIALLLADIALGGANSGWQLAADFRRENAALKVVFNSGHCPDALPGNLAIEPCCWCVQKPCDAARLTQTVRLALEQS